MRQSQQAENQKKRERFVKGLDRWKMKTLKHLTKILKRAEELSEDKCCDNHEITLMKCEAQKSSQHLNLLTYGFYKLFNSIEMITHDGSCKLDVLMSRLMKLVMHNTYYFKFHENSLASAMKKSLAFHGLTPREGVERAELLTMYKQEFDKCAVCLETYKDNDKVAILTCRHHCHSNCLSQWFIKTTSSSLGPRSLKSLDFELQKLWLIGKTRNQCAKAGCEIVERIKNETRSLNVCPICRSNPLGTDFSNESVAAYLRLSKC